MNKIFDNKKTFFIKKLLSNTILKHQQNLKSSKSPFKNLLHFALPICFITISFVFLMISYNRNVFFLKKGVIITRNLTEQLTRSKQFGYDQFNALATLYQFHWLIKSHPRKYTNLGLYRGFTLLPYIDIIITSVMQKHFLKKNASSIENILKNDEQKWNKKTKKTKEDFRGKYYAALESYLALCYPIKNSLTERSIFLSQYWFPEKKTIKNKVGLISIYLKQLFNQDNMLITKPWQCDKTLIRKSRNQLSLPIDAKNIWDSFVLEFSLLKQPLSLNNFIKKRYFLQRRKITKNLCNV